MEFRYFMKSAVLSGLCVAALSGCDSFKRAGVPGSEGRVVTLADGRKVVVSGQKQAGSPERPPEGKKGKKLVPPKTVGKDNKSKSKKGQVQQPVSADREDIALIAGSPECEPDTTAATGSAAVFQGGDDGETRLDVEWTICSVRGNPVTGEERPYVTFDIPVNRFYGNNGCNYINGDMTLGSDGTVRFSNIISTMKMCADDHYQYLINLAFDDVVSYSVRKVRHETFLDMSDASGRIILVLRHHNMDFLNGAWRVTELNGAPLVQEEVATMTFDTTDLKIHGTTGCNIFNGELFIDPDKTTSLQVLKLATTKMACPVGSNETEILLALESVETAKPDGQNEAMLYDTDGNALFKLVKMDLRADSTDDE